MKKPAIEPKKVISVSHGISDSIHIEYPIKPEPLPINVGKPRKPTDGIIIDGTVGIEGLVGRIYDK